jgi:hypothetical protein
MWTSQSREVRRANFRWQRRERPRRGRAADNTRYIFGFTEGADTERVIDRAADVEQHAHTRLAKRIKELQPKVN